MKRGKIVAILLTFGLLVAVVAGCGGGPTSATPEPEAPGPIVAGANIGYPPFEYMEGDKAVGFDIDLWTEVGVRLDRETTFMNIPWEGLIPGLLAEKFDVIMSCMGITEKRLEQVDFSKPYYKSRFALAVLKESPVNSLADLKGTKVGIQTGTMAEAWIRDHETELGIAEIIPYDEMPDAILDLQAKRIDVAANDFPYLAHLAKANPDIRVVDETFGDGINIGIAFRKEDTELRAEVDRAIDEIIADGTYAQIYAKWFGREPSADEMPR